MRVFQPVLLSLVVKVFDLDSRICLQIERKENNCSSSIPHFGKQFFEGCKSLDGFEFMLPLAVL